MKPSTLAVGALAPIFVNFVNAVPTAALKVSDFPSKNLADFETLVDAVPEILTDDNIVVWTTAIKLGLDQMDNQGDIVPTETHKQVLGVLETHIQNLKERKGPANVTEEGL